MANSNIIFSIFIMAITVESMKMSMAIHSLSYSDDTVFWIIVHPL